MEKLKNLFERFYVVREKETLKVEGEEITSYSFEHGVCGCPGCLRRGHCKHLDMRNHLYVGKGCPADRLANKIHTVERGLKMKFALGDWGEQEIVRIDRAKRCDEFVVTLFEGVALYLPIGELKE